MAARTRAVGISKDKPDSETVEEVRSVDDATESGSSEPDSKASVDPIEPSEYWEDSGIPIFRPTMDQFRSFPEFISRIHHHGSRAGIIKVVPPAEWTQQLPNDLSDEISQIKIKNPIEQHISGRGGLFRQQNIEKQKSYTLQDWRNLCDQSNNQPPESRGRVRKKANRSQDKSQSAFDYKFDDSSFTRDRCEFLERLYWKTLTYAEPLYGADMLGSLFNAEATSTWNVAQLDDTLNKLPTKIPGVNTAYLYYGMWKATFAWHLEDMDLYSINYIHFGAPKQWYAVPPAYAGPFQNLMKENFPIDYKNCHEFLRHKTFHASPAYLRSHQIPVNKLVHYQGEFVITFPYAYHSGYNYGYNVAESVNFTTEDWIHKGIGRGAKKCECIDDAVGLNIDQLERILSGEPEPEMNPNEDELDNSDEETSTDASTDDELRRKLPTPPHEKPKAKRGREKKTPAVKVEVSNKATRYKKSRHLLPSLKCVLCPNLFDLEFVRTAGEDKKYAHKLCAEYTPETYFSDANAAAPPQLQSASILDPNLLAEGITTIPKARWSLKCAFCLNKQGSCIQCSHPKCSRSYHATCADMAGVLVEINPADTDADINTTHTYLCRYHRPGRQISQDAAINNEIYESNSALTNWVYGLLPGDITQIQYFDHNEIYAGVVRENNRRESMLMLEILPERKDVIEVQWKHVLLPPDLKRVVKRSFMQLDTPDKQTKRAKISNGSKNSTKIVCNQPSKISGGKAQTKSQDKALAKAQARKDKELLKEQKRILKESQNPTVAGKRFKISYESAFSQYEAGTIVSTLTSEMINDQLFQIFTEISAQEPSPPSLYKFKKAEFYYYIPLESSDSRARYSSVYGGLTPNDPAFLDEQTRSRARTERKLQKKAKLQQNQLENLPISVPLPLLPTMAITNNVNMPMNLVPMNWVANNNLPHYYGSTEHQNVGYHQNLKFH